MRLRRPRIATLDEVIISKEGEYAVIEFCEPRISTMNLKIGPKLNKMTDKQILASFNRTVRAMEEVRGNYVNKPVAIPEGEPRSFPILRSYFAQKRSCGEGNDFKFSRCVGGLQQIFHSSKDCILNRILAAPVALHDRQLFENYNCSFGDLEGKVRPCRMQFTSTDSARHFSDLLVFKSAFHSSGSGTYVVITRTLSPSISVANRTWNRDPASIR
jgi:hypothetical protein